MSEKKEEERFKIGLCAFFFILILSYIFYYFSHINNNGSYYILSNNKEYVSDVINPQHLELGEYSPDLYGELTRNRNYSNDFEAAMKYGDDYNKMSGLKFGSFDVNQALGYGNHQQEENVDYI